MDRQHMLTPRMAYPMGQAMEIRMLASRCNRHTALLHTLVLLRIRSTHRSRTIRRRNRCNGSSRRAKDSISSNSAQLRPVRDLKMAQE